MQDFGICEDGRNTITGLGIVQSGARRSSGQEFRRKGLRMKTGRWLTGIGSVVLFLTGIGHGTRIVQLQKMIVDGGMKAPLDVILKACWLAFSGEMVALAVIAMVASAMAGGGRIVLICAATMIVNAVLLLHFVGASFPVYVSGPVGVFLLAGGLMQSQQAA